MGKRKIEIKKIESKSKLQVTFSKRRQGLFKKAMELCTLCNVSIGIVVFSPAGKPYSFGNPSIETVVDCFLNGSNPISPNKNQLQEIVSDKNGVEDEKRKSWDLWKEISIEETGGNLQDLVRAKKRLVEVKEKVLMRLKEIEYRRLEEELAKEGDLEFSGFQLGPLWSFDDNELAASSATNFF